MQTKNSKISKKTFRRLLSFFVLIALIITPIKFNENVLRTTKAATTVESGPTKNMSDGSILHAWCWSFNTIKENMELIAESGYTSIQTSPINNIASSNDNNLQFTDQWWYQYQPIDYQIGNYQLGSETEFAAMCQEAEKYGIKIIVDVVVNHCTSDYSLISNNIKNIPNFFHTNTGITNWNDRYQVTQLALLGLWDLNTQNSNVQAYIKNYLEQCISLGADGFRFDSAKHIELPDDGSYGGNFWPNVLSNGSEFQYGEIIQDVNSREEAYANYMSVTATTYGNKIRSQIGNNDLSTSSILSYNIGVSSDNIVTWVESHDTYANDLSSWGSSQWMTDEQIKLAWAVVCARNGGTPVFFSRPVGGGGTSWDNRFPEITSIGDRGSSLFFDDEVIAVNKFRNAMVGESEYLRNPNGNSKILMIERGTKGVAIVNMNSSSTALSSATNLANGSYTNKTNDNRTFTVSNGILKGTLPARSVVVLYGSDSTPTPTPTSTPSNDVTVYFEKPSFWGNNVNAYVYESNNTTFKENASWPGIAMTKNNNGTYQYTFTDSYTDPLIIFNDGNTQTPPSQQPGYAIVSGETYTVDGLKPIATPTVTPTATATPTVTPKPNNTVTIYYKTSWTKANIHYQIASNPWTTSPGVPMNDTDVSGYKTITINLGTSSTVTACFNDGNGIWDNNNDKNYTFHPGIYTLADGSISNGKLLTNSNTVTVYYYTGWSNPYIHYQLGSGNWTTTPGVVMSSSSYFGYKVITIDLGTASNLTGCFNNGNGSWDNRLGNNYYLGSSGFYTIKNGNVYNGKP